MTSASTSGSVRRSADEGASRQADRVNARPARSHGRTIGLSRIRTEQIRAEGYTRQPLRERGNGDRDAAPAAGAASPARGVPHRGRGLIRRGLRKPEKPVI
ncbi:hypothetical protein GCM10009546_67860 [Actinomadura livida]|uniref:Uncharacterized protein n=1 Tax=Actinomadura livida TaxID=79909 RepID=A0ABP3QXL7_9ACTN|nr:hypothetical protein GCM10010208_20380 [Actinomadura livida]